MTQILLQAPQGGGTFQLIMLGGIIVVFWFFMIRPQAKKAKEQKCSPKEQIAPGTAVSRRQQAAERCRNWQEAVSTSS